MPQPQPLHDELQWADCDSVQVVGDPQIVSSKLHFVTALRAQRFDGSADFVITAGEHSFRVHSVVISLHSSYFKSICEGSFKEGVERRVDLQDDAPLAVWAMVDYFYTFEYEDLMDMHSGLGESRPHNSIQGHSQVFTAADKYDVPGLCELACNRFAAATLLDTLIPCSGSFYHKLAADLMAAIAHVYNHTPPDDHRLRDAAVSAWEAKGKSLLVHVNKADLQALFAEVPDFGVDVLARIANIPIGRYDDYHNIGNLDPTADAKDKDSNIEVFGWPSIDCLL